MFMLSSVLLSNSLYSVSLSVYSSIWYEVFCHLEQCKLQMCHKRVVCFDIMQISAVTNRPLSIVLLLGNLHKWW